MAIIIECIMILLLVAVIVRTYQISQKLKALRGAEETIRPLLNSLVHTTRSTTMQIEAVRESSTQIHHMLSGQVKNASALKNDLEFMLSHGENVADRLEGLIRDTSILCKNLTILRAKMMVDAEPMISNTQVLHDAKISSFSTKKEDILPILEAERHTVLQRQHG